MASVDARQWPDETCEAGVMQEQLIKIESRTTTLSAENGESPGQVPELSVIVPTFNERDNVAEIVQRLEASLSGNAWEVIFVDDD